MPIDPRQPAPTPHDGAPSAGARAVTAVAPAKINLLLGVGDLRADGFHDVRTVYRAVDLWEEVTVGFADSDDDMAITVTGPGAEQVPTDRTNLAARAVDLLSRESGSDARFAIQIRKGVPVAGGMAGGSADAAAALVATNRLLGLGLSRAELEERGSRLGSDVPFCLRGGTAVGTGRGEELATLLHARTPQHVVVALADGGLSTPVVFGELDRLRAEHSADSEHVLMANRVTGTDELVAALAEPDPAAVAELLANDMEPAALSLMPTLRRTLRAGEEAGALHGMVSGSGPTCLFFCADREHAITVAAELSESGVAREVRITSGPVGGAHIIDGPGAGPAAAQRFQGK